MQQSCYPRLLQNFIWVRARVYVIHCLGIGREGADGQDLLGGGREASVALASH